MMAVGNDDDEMAIFEHFHKLASSVCTAVGTLVLSDEFFDIERLVYFAGFQVNIFELHFAMQQAEEQLQPALFLSQVLKADQFNEMDAEVAERICFQVWERKRRRKCSVVEVVSDLDMMRYMVGLDVGEFSVLFLSMAPILCVEFPRTPLKATTTNVTPGLTIELMLFLTLHRLKHLSSLRYLQGLVGFSFSHLGNVMNRTEVCMKHSLLPYLRQPTLDELQYWADLHYRTVSINGIYFRIGYMVDATYSIIPTPGDPDIQEIYYTRYVYF